MQCRFFRSLATALVVAASVVPATAQPPAAMPVTEATRQLAATIAGQVRNADGTPAANVEVWAAWSFVGIREELYTRHTRTDAAGYYRIENVTVLAGITIHPPTDVDLFATGSNAPPALGALSLTTAEARAPLLQFPKAEASVAVTVCDVEGKPVVGACVQARTATFKHEVPDGMLNYFAFLDESHKELRHALAPRVLTDANGIAYFTHLRPDNYTFTAAQFGGNGDGGSISLAPGMLRSSILEPRHKPIAIVENVELPAGQTPPMILKLVPRKAPAIPSTGQ